MDGSSYIKNAFESEITHLNQLVFDLEGEKADIEGNVQWLQCRGKKRKICVADWLNDLQILKKRADDMKNVHPCLDNIHESRIKKLIREVQKHKEKMPMVLSTEFVGTSFEENTRKIWKLLADDQVFRIGVYGMGGVGKTLLANHVENEIKRKGVFKDVFWVTVSQNSSILKLQHDIAKKIGVKLDEDDERVRAANLCLALETRENSVLILDDVWKYIDFEKVGIPGVIKVILTTRLKHVCQQMDCLPNNMINMLPFDMLMESNDAIELFKIKVGHYGTPTTLSPEVEKIASSIINRFKGLPLGISLMARTMKGLLDDDIVGWKHAWNKPEKLEIGEEVEEEVFKVLKRSYDNLMDRDLKNCFLYCALLPYLERNELIMKLVDNRLINGRTLVEIFDEGMTILDKLQSHSLLLKDVKLERRHELEVRIHGLVVDMACHILKESQRCVMVKFEKGLGKEWTPDLELVNLMPGNIQEIPEGMSPCCPRLSTLVLGGYSFSPNHICHIPECFFQNMNALTILHLSENDGLESLPSSLSNLRSLVSLVLNRCVSLKYVPPLGQLQALSRLVISDCSVEKVPDGLEKLINLKWLDLSWNENLVLVTGSLLPKLTNLQYLDLRECPHVKIKVEDVQAMKMLECFGGIFLDCKDYNCYVQNILNKDLGPKTYHLFVEKCSLDLESILPNGPQARTINFGDCEGFSLSQSHSHILPKDFTDLCIYHNKHWVCLCDALSPEYFSSLRKIKVDYCHQLKSVFCFSSSCFFCTNNVHNLEELNLEDLKSLTVICKEEVPDVRQSFSTGVMFPWLKDFRIYACHSIEKLLTPRLVLQLPNIERITVEYCYSMQEIFAEGNSDCDDGFSITLPKLITLELRFLPKLKTVFKRLVSQLSNLERITVEDCCSMEEIFAVDNRGDNDGSSTGVLPKLTRLELLDLPQLKTVSKGIISFGSFPTFQIKNCRNFDWNSLTMPVLVNCNDTDDDSNA